nr:MAG TPA: hypothetical protein [Caudoviricetes sp.]
MRRFVNLRVFWNDRFSAKFDKWSARILVTVSN